MDSGDSPQTGQPANTPPAGGAKEPRPDRQVLGRNEDLVDSLDNAEQFQRWFRWRIAGFIAFMAILTVATMTLMFVAGTRPKKDRPAMSPSRSGWDLYERGEFTTAEKRFAKAVEIEPANIDAWNGLAWSRLREGLVLAAEDAFKNAIRHNMNDAKANDGLGYVFFARQEYRIAEDYWRKVRPPSTDSILGLVRLYLIQERYEEALPLARNLVERLPNDDYCQELHAIAVAGRLDDESKAWIEPSDPAFVSEDSRQAMELLNDGSQTNPVIRRRAVDAYHRAVFRNPHEIAAHLGLAAWQLHQRHDCDSAMRHYDICLQADPGNQVALAGLGRCFSGYASMGRIAQATSLLRRAEKLVPNPVDIERGGIWRMGLAELASACLDRRLLDDALAYYNRLAETESVPGTGLNGLGRTYLKRGNAGQALECFKRLMRHDPEQGVDGVMRVYFELSRPDEAIALLSQEIERKPDLQSSSLYVRKLAEVYRQVFGQTDEAISFFQRIAGMSEEPNSGVYGLALVHRQRGEPDRAVSYYEQLLQANQEYSRVVGIELLTIYVMRNEFTKALTLLESVGESIHDRGMADTMLTHMEQASARSPDAATIKQRIDALREKRTE